jgi:hypothetical protein
MWLNDQFGDCVTAEEAFAKAAYSVMNGQPEVFIQDSVVQTWATQNGFLDGANLTDVMDQMAKSGFQQGGVTYGDGPYASVDYSTESVLQNAISLGPVKIGIDANALPSGAGNQQGWVATGGSPGQFQNEDHCVSLCGYGTAQYLFQQLGVSLPSGLQPTQTGYLLYTWSTIGFVDHAWIMSTCAEAWLRNPTTPGTNPPPPPPPPPTPSSGVVTVDATNKNVTVPSDWTVNGGGQIPANILADIQKLNADLTALNPKGKLALKVSVVQFLMDVEKLTADLKAGNALAIPADIAKIEADLGK